MLINFDKKVKSSIGVMPTLSASELSSSENKINSGSPQLHKEEQKKEVASVSDEQTSCQTTFDHELIHRNELEDENKGENPS